MIQKSRTEYSARNTTSAVLFRMTAIVLGYVTRVIFTRTLSEAYVGINGLFTDILNVLALSEMGVGTAITYALYQPIAKADREKQKSLMQLFCWLYRLIAVFVLGAGLLVIPFLGKLIRNQPDIEHLVLIYLMYLASSVLSYLLIYKRTLLDAHQLLYVGTIYRSVFLVLQNVLQIVALIRTQNFILFLSIHILCTLLANISLSAEANRRYPYLRDREVQPLQKSEKKKIFDSMQAMLMHKVGNVVVNNTDNLLLSAMVGIVSVGRYSNYYLVIGSVRQVLDEAFRGVTASVGNMGVTEKPERIHKIFEVAFFTGQWLYGFAAICLFELLNPFVEISFGQNYLFSRNVVFILCLNFFVTGMRSATLVFRDSLGLFWFDRYKSVVEALINLVASILLAYPFGTAGVFIGTLISTVTTSLWVEPYMLYKHHLGAPVLPYFIRYALYSGVVGGIWFLTDGICDLIEGSVWIVLGGRFLICMVVPNVLLLLCYCRTKEFRYLLDKMKELIGARVGRMRN